MHFCVDNLLFIAILNTIKIANFRCLLLFLVCMHKTRFASDYVHINHIYVIIYTIEFIDHWKNDIAQLSGILNSCALSIGQTW